MALGNDGIRPDASELRIRFVCGAIVGAFLAGGTVFRMGTSGAAFALVAILGGSVGGALARRFGDRFWFALRRNWPSEGRDFRLAVDEELRRVLLENAFDLDVEVLEVQGSPQARLKQVVERLSAEQRS
jgi:hypothetical protein